MVCKFFGGLRAEEVFGHGVVGAEWAGWWWRVWWCAGFVVFSLFTANPHAAIVLGVPQEGVRIP